MDIGQREVRIDLHGLVELDKRLLRPSHGHVNGNRPGVEDRHHGIEVDGLLDLTDGLVEPQAIQKELGMIGVEGRLPRPEGQDAVETRRGRFPVELEP
jgi:hypothetical protein